MSAQAIYGWARRAPERPALVYNGTRFSYALLARLIDLSRAHLEGLGLAGPGHAVLLVHSLLDGWILGLAARSLGLTTVVARSAAEIARLSLPRITCVIVTAAEPRPGLETARVAGGWPVVAFPAGLYAGAAAMGAPEAPDWGPAGGHILLTSGTTGEYKKVLIEPRHEPALHRRRQAIFGFGEDTALALFDFGGWTGMGYKAALAVWGSGGAVVLSQEQPRWQGLADPGLTHAFVTPLMLQEILEAPEGALQRNDALLLSVTAGPLTRLLAEGARARLTTALHAHVGATETSTFAFTRIETEDDRRWHRIVEGCRVEVVDEAGAPMPTGEEGLLRVRIDEGPMQYMDDPAASAAFFEDGWFRPGDIAVLRADGRLALRGRVTDVINVMGDKIAPGPLEDALREGLGVSAACLLSWQNDSGEEELHVVIETPTAIDGTRLAEVLSDTVGRFERAQVTFISAMPRNAMGKIDRRMLRRTLVDGRRG